MAITIELPRDVESDLEMYWPDLPRKAMEAVLLESYRQGVLSRGKISEILGLSFDETEAFLKEHGAFLHYDKEDLRSDLEALDRLLSKNASEE